MDGSPQNPCHLHLSGSRGHHRTGTPLWQPYFGLPAVALVVVFAHYSAGGAVQRRSAVEEPARVVVGRLQAIRAGWQADLHDILVNRRRAMAFSDCEDTDGY